MCRRLTPPPGGVSNLLPGGGGGLGCSDWPHASPKAQNNILMHLFEIAFPFVERDINKLKKEIIR